MQMKLIVSLCLLLGLVACGGGGGGSSSSTATLGVVSTPQNFTVPTAITTVPPQ